MLGKIIVALALVACVSATDVKPCRSGLPLPVNADVAGCETMPCDIIRNQTAEMIVDLVAPAALTKIPIKVVAIYAGVDVPYPLPDNNACDGLIAGQCPLAEGDEVVWTLGFFVDSSFPAVTGLQIEFTLENDAATPEAWTCFSIDAEVK